MKEKDILTSFSSLIKNTRKYLKVKREFTKNLEQCAVVTIFKFTNKYLEENPIFKKNLKEVLNIQSESKRIDLLLEILHKAQTNPNKENRVLEILYTQRVINPKDKHSGQVCFPGGKLDEGESDIKGGLREVKEEIGVELLPLNSVIIGKMPLNYFAYIKKNKKYLISQIFSLALANLEDEDCLEVENMELSQDEIEAAWWLDFGFFFLKHTEDQLVRLERNSLNFDLLSFAFTDIFKNYLDVNIKKKIENMGYFTFTFYTLKFPNSKALWGVTLLLTGCMMELCINENMSIEIEKTVSNFALKSRRYVAVCGDEEVDYFMEYGMRCREEILNMRKLSFLEKIASMRL